MKTLEIVDNNKLIAEFMGAYPQEDRIDADVLEYELYGILDHIEDGEDEQHFFHPEEMKFHESWDWLMPVVEKIESLDNGVIVEINGSYTIANGIDQDYYLEYGGLSKIDNTYRAIVEFVKWYNQQNAE